MDNKAEYYIERFRSTIVNTNKIGLLFLFTLTYVWFKSIQPNFDKVQKFMTLNNQRLYFKNVDSSLNSRNNSRLNALYTNKKTAQFKLIEQYDNVDAKKVYDYNYSKKNQSYVASATKINEEYNAVALPIRKLDSSIRKQLDGLASSLVEIDVPTLKSVEFKLSIAIPIWMFLTTFFVFFIYTNRQIAFKYLTKGLRLYSNQKTDVDQMQHFDVNIAYWLQPLNVESKSYSKADITRILFNYNKITKTIFIVICLLVILIVQFYTAALVWNLNKILNIFPEDPSKSEGTSSTVFCFVMFLLTLVISVKWVLSKNIIINNESNGYEKEKDISRRQFLMYSSISVATVAIAAVITIKPLNVIIPPINGVACNYARNKKSKPKKTVPLHNYSGFYINKKRNTIHYFTDKGMSPSLKTVTNRKQFASNLKKIEILEYVNQIKAKKINFPYYLFAIEDAALLKMNNNNINEALKMLQVNVELSLYSENFQRAKDVFRKQINVNAKKLKPTDRVNHLAFLKSMEQKAEQLYTYIESKTKV